MEETTGMHYPIFSILDGEQKSNFINNMDQMGPLMNQMDNINQMSPLMVIPSMMKQSSYVIFLFDLIKYSL